MTIVVAVPDSPEGARALSAGAAEAEMLGTDFVVVNLGLRPLDTSAYSGVEVVRRSGPNDRDQVDVVLDAISKRRATRLVIGVKRRSPVGKAVLGSVSQQLLLRSPVPVLAVTLDKEEE
jgi:nucleotide-binding universal stress UspA family protein